MLNGSWNGQGSYQLSAITRQLLWIVNCELWKLLAEEVEVSPPATVMLCSELTSISSLTEMIFSTIIDFDEERRVDF